MLAVAILALVVEFVLNIFIGVNVAFDNNAANWAVTFLAIGCLALAVVALVKGIKGIRDPLTRGRSIATTIVAGSAVTYGLALVLIAYLVAAGIYTFSTSGNGDFTFTFSRMLGQF